MLTQAELEAIRKRAEGATKGPWLQYTYGNYEDSIVWGPFGPGYGKICEVFLNYAQKPKINDVEFIANAREDIPKLLAEVERLTAEVHRLEIENKTLEKVATKQTIKVERESDFDWYVGY